MEREVIWAATITLIVLVIIIITLFVIFQTKKNRYILYRIEAAKKFEEEIEKSQNEIREQSLKNIAWELHDNVGQLLSMVKIQLSVLERTLQDDHQKGEVADINRLIGTILQEIRMLSKTLNAETVRQMGLVIAIRTELDRFNKLNFLSADLQVIGKETPLEPKDEIIIFRILQEFFANVIKHSRANSLKVSLEYLPEKLLITVQDDGIGFDPLAISTGSGLLNMRSRAQLIGLSFDLHSEKNKGVRMSLGYFFKKTVE